MRASWVSPISTSTREALQGLYAGQGKRSLHHGTFIPRHLKPRLGTNSATHGATSTAVLKTGLKLWIGRTECGGSCTGLWDRIMLAASFTRATDAQAYAAVRAFNW